MTGGADLAHLLSAEPAAPRVDDVVLWAAGWRALQAQGHAPFALALRGGFMADRVGWAFAAGYQAALQTLPQGGVARGALRSFCVTEATGNRPRDVATRLQAAPGGWVIDGAKRWSTLAPVADALLVVARDAGAGDAAQAARPVLTAAWVAAGTPGLQVQPMPATPFVPEVPHAQLTLSAVTVAAADRLPGDAYTTLVKPFRTLEDGYVAAAALAWLLREARARRWPAGFVERCAAQLAGLAWLAAQDPAAAATHVGLAGALQAAAVLHDEAGTLWADAEAAARWQRDRRLFTVAGEARRLRLDRAWQRLAAPAADG